MGFIAGKNTIITSDWEIDKKCVMTPRQKSESISFYKENESIKIIKPTIKVIEHFGNKIGYSTPTVRICSIKNNKEEIIQFFSDPRYKFYLSKIVHYGVFNAYFTQFDNIPHLREQKLKSIGI